VAGATVVAVPFESSFEERREARRGEPPKPLATTTNRPDGTWVLTLAPAAAPRDGAALVRLKVSGGGTAPTLLESVFDAAQSAEAGDATVAKAATLAGRVVDARGGPVVAATVTFVGGGGGGPFVRAGSSQVPMAATTGADGTVRFTEAAVGSRLRVEAPGFATTEVGTGAGGALHKPISLVLGRAVSVQVLKEDRRTPAGGALVRFEGHASTRWFETRADGTVLIDGVPPEAGARQSSPASWLRWARRPRCPAAHRRAVPRSGRAACSAASDFDPYGLAHRSGFWHAVGHCHLREGLRSFRGDRIRGVRPTSARFERPAGFDALGHLTFSVTTLPRTYAVEVLLKADLPAARRQLFATLGILEPTTEGTLLRGQRDDLGWFARELARLPFSLEIRRPAELRQALRERTRTLLRRAGA
jgi:hypothetical protein